MIHDGRSRKLPFDPEDALKHLRQRDAKLGTLIERVGPFTMKLDRAPSPFESLLESILYQQLHGKAAATIHARVRECYKGDPSPKALIDTPDEVLRGCGVSFNKIKAMKDLAAKTIDGTVPSHRMIDKMPDAEIVERLTEVRGIGPWTVEMLLIFRMGRPDVLPVTDYACARVMHSLFSVCPNRERLKQPTCPSRMLSSSAASVGNRSARLQAGICGARATWPRAPRPPDDRQKMQRADSNPPFCAVFSYR